jgi:hypothetical protein
VPFMGKKSVSMANVFEILKLFSKSSALVNFLKLLMFQILF